MNGRKDKMMSTYISDDLMIADSMYELHRVAMEMGLDRTSYKHRDVPHYPISEAQREAALKNGAIRIPNEDFLCKVRELKRRRA